MSKSMRQEIVDILNSIPPSDNWVKEAMCKLAEYDPKLAETVRELAGKRFDGMEKK